MWEERKVEYDNSIENETGTEVMKNSINAETNISFDDFINGNLQCFYLSPSIIDWFINVGEANKSFEGTAGSDEASKLFGIKPKDDEDTEKDENKPKDDEDNELDENDLLENAKDEEDDGSFKNGNLIYGIVLLYLL